MASNPSDKTSAFGGFTVRRIEPAGASDGAAHAQRTAGAGGAASDAAEGAAGAIGVAGAADGAGALGPDASEAEIQEVIQQNMYAHYKYTFFGALLAIPIGIRRKSLWPLAALGSVGTMADFASGYTESLPLRDRLRDLRHERQRQEALAKARATDSASAKIPPPPSR